jgi:uncharacterized protein YecT (DUF1311 family)
LKNFEPGRIQVREERETPLELKEEQHDIDKKIEQLMAKAPSTVEQVKVLDTAYRLWDAELNRVYKLLYARLPAAGKRQLQVSQRAWLVWRDAELKTIDAVFATTDGAQMYLAMRKSLRVDVVRTRVLSLQKLLGVGQEIG